MKKRLFNRNQLLKSPVLLDFVEACLKYIRLIEEESRSKEEFLNKVHRALCNLYATALPFMEMEFAGPFEYVRLDRRIIWPEGIPNILAKVGDDKFYKEVFNPFSIDKYEPTTMSISDDIMDIYHQIKTGISFISLDTENAIATGIFTLQNNFSHWGRHCVTAIRAIHFLRFEPEIEDEIVNDVLNNNQ